MPFHKLHFMLRKKKKVGRAMQEGNKRPWGYFEVLSDAPDHKVKRIVVEPGGILSLQRHQLRAEHWFIVSGSGRMTLEDKQYPVSSSSAIDIPMGTKHRIENTSSGNLVIIEVQTGTYFGENDIERLEDKYGRAP
jgi:mannose-6-phosphate isomerase-like protein (cupin superfamily)